MIEEMDNQPLVVELDNASGEKVKVELLFYFTNGEREFMVANNIEDDTDSYILEYVTGENGPELVNVDDPVEFKELSKIAVEVAKQEEENEELNG